MRPSTLAEYTMQVIANLMALGHLDVVTNLKAVFNGNERVLQDIKILADHDYGEDRHGNNISLPLSYLRR